MIDRVLSNETEECDDALELELEALNREIKEAERLFQKRSPKEKAYALIRLFFETSNEREDGEENNQSRVPELFYGWLLSPENQEAKEAALFQVFEEMMDMPIDIPLRIRTPEPKETALAN